MSKSAPLEGRGIARSPYLRSLGQGSLTRRPASPPERLRDQELLANELSDDSWGAGIRSSPVGVVGYSMHGVTLLFLSFWALYHFGQVFWFFSIVIAAVGMISLYYAYAARGESAKSKTKRGG